MAKNYYLSGQWNVTCDVCSKKIKSSEARNRWDGLVTCPDCWEQRHPLDFIKARTDKITVPFQRPIPTLEFVPQNFTQPLTNKVSLDDKYTKVASFTRAYTDSVSTTDNGISVQIGHGRLFTDTVNFSETFDTFIYILLEVADSVPITESFVKEINSSRTESIVLTEAILKTSSTSKTDSVVSTDYFTKGIGIPNIESISIAESFTKEIQPVKSDLVSITDLENKVLVQNQTELVNIVDGYTKIANFSLVPTDSVSLLESFSHPTKNSINNNAINTQAINGISLFTSFIEKPDYPINSTAINTKVIN